MCKIVCSNKHCQKFLIFLFSGATLQRDTFVFQRHSDGKFIGWSNLLCFQAQINDSSVGRYVVTVGSINYYLPYNIKIRSFNPMGYGPMSPIVTIMSAEERK